MRTERSKHKADRTGHIGQFHCWLVTAYLVLSPIYWFPGIDHTLIRNVKLALFGASVAIGLVASKRVTKPILDIQLQLFALGALVIATNLATGDAGSALSASRDFVEPALWLLGLNAVQGTKRRTLIRNLKYASIIMGVAVSAPVFASLGIIQNREAPIEMYAFALDRSGVGETGWYWANKASLSGGGFAAQSTTWGASVALMGLLFLGLLHTKPTKTNPHGKPTKSANLFAAICAAGIIVTSARGALLSLVLGWTIANLKRWSFRNLVQVALMIAIATITARAIAPTDITRNLDNTATSLLETIDNMTTGRLTTVLKGIQTAAKRSVSGVGYGKSSDYDTGLVPHNTSIRLAAESGIAAGLLSLAMQISIILRTLKHRRNATETDMFPLVAGAVILAQVEPSVFFGTFNANAFLWTGIWLTTQSQQANVHQAV